MTYHTFTSDQFQQAENKQWKGWKIVEFTIKKTGTPSNPGKGGDLYCFDTVYCDSERYLANDPDDLEDAKRIKRGGIATLYPSSNSPESRLESHTGLKWESLKNIVDQVENY